MKKILITGISGFIASSIAKTLKGEGFYIIGTSRKPVLNSNVDVNYQGILGEPLKAIFETHAIDTVIHCAYDKWDRRNTINAEGTCLWAEQAEKNGVRLQIFMSSISAAEDSVSSYGQKKFEVEKWFTEHNHVVFRLGLVIGDGGIFQMIISMVRKYPVIPLIDNGKTLTYISDIDLISNIVKDSISKEDTFLRGKVWNLQQETPVFFIDILKAIKRLCRTFCIFIPVPYTLVSLFIFLVEKIKFLKIGIDTNNLKGMRQNSQKILKSDLGFIGYQEIPFEEIMQKLRIQ